jgi:putative addiction module component (TIGR02574 family)|tara:strand:+ start:163 stop:414 length:252 start_codon:yes stop_codon:yes gene_type:complete
MKEEILSEALKLSIQDRIVFVEDIWDSIANVPESVELTEAQKKELDKRLEEYHKNPDAGSPWDEVKSKLLAKNGLKSYFTPRG